MHKNYQKLKTKILLSITIVVIIIAGVRLLDDVVGHTQEMKKKTTLVEKQFRTLFLNELEHVHNHLEGRLKGLSQQKNIMKHLASGDRELLLKEVKKRYKIIKEEFPNVKQMHFFSPGAVTLLRVHKPEKFGDYLGEKRPIISIADKERKTMFGFSFGLHDKGNLTYRVVKPMYYDNKYIGLLEFGYDFKNALHKINNTISEFYGINNFSRHEILIREELLILHKNDFPIRVGKFVMNYEATNGLEAILKEYAQTKSNKIRIDDKIYNIIVIDKVLKDFKNDDAGIILSIHDMTHEYKLYDEKIFQAVLKPLIVLAVLLIIFTYIFNKFIKDTIYIRNRKDLILNAQKNIVVVTNGKQIIETNNTFLEFFGYEDLSEFKKHYNCICDRFLQSDEEVYLQPTYENGKLWSDRVIDEAKTTHKALIEDKNGDKHIFEVKGSKILLGTEKEEVLVFNDITFLEEQKREMIEQDKIISEQSKMVQMGEMIGNIAHQWRQPLSVISTSASGLLVKDQLGMLKDGDMEKYCENIVNNANYLSETIDTFRDFLKEKKEYKEVIVQDRIETALEIVKDTLLNNYIKVEKDLWEEPIKKGLVVGELSQVLINILNNAKDILVENDVDNKFIKIDLKMKESYIVISIEDNGGGIPTEILPKIFAPYFTTKHQSQGTGLGLHMSYKIVTESLKGKLYAQNTKEGAKFTIEIPKD